MTKLEKIEELVYPINALLPAPFSKNNMEHIEKEAEEIFEEYLDSVVGDIENEQQKSRYSFEVEVEVVVKIFKKI